MGNVRRKKRRNKMIKETKSKGSIRYIAFCGIFILLCTFGCYRELIEKKEINFVIQITTLLLFFVWGIYEAKKIIRMQSQKTPISKLVWYFLAAILLYGTISPYIYVGLSLLLLFIIVFISCFISERKNKIKVYYPLTLTDTTDMEFVKK